MDTGGDHGRIQLMTPNPVQYFTPGVIVLLVLLVAGYVLTSYGGDRVLRLLTLDPRLVIRGRIWQLVTYAFVGACGWPVVLNGLGILLCGSAIERQWRAKSFLLLWLFVTVACGILWTVLSLLISLFTKQPYPPYVGAGAASGVYGIFGAFALVYRRHRVLSMLFIMYAEHFVWLVIAIGIILSLGAPMTLIWVGGAGVGYLYVKFLWRRRTGRRRNGADQVGRFAEID